MAKPPLVLVATHPSGGIRELWENLAAAIEARGQPTRLLAFYPPSQVDRATGQSPWTILSPTRPGIADWTRITARLHRWLARERPAMIVTAMPAANVLTPPIARIASPASRIVLTHHSPSQTHSRLLDRIDAATGRLRNVVAVVGVSDTVTRSFDHRPARYRARLRTIANALPPEIEALLDTLAPPLPRTRAASRRLAATGRLDYQKNYPFLLRALAHVPDATLDVIGQGADEASLKALSDHLGIADRVVFHGFRPREEVLALLAGSDLFCQVSRFEGHSLGLIEAARLGLPLIVSDVPEQVEAVTAHDGTCCGTIVGQDDDAALTAAIARLLDNPAIYSIASADAHRIAQEAKFDEMVGAYIALAG